MGIEVSHPAPLSAEDAETELRSQGLHFLTLDVPAVENTAHWHSFSSVFYITSGTLQLTDVASGAVHEAGPGARVSVPERVLHSERSERGYSILLGVSRDPTTFEDPVNLLPESLPGAEGSPA
jgi:mannose-6-phosphate isomerase-like protein (cupin superfamily)